MITLQYRIEQMDEPDSVAYAGSFTQWSKC